MIRYSPNPNKAGCIRWREWGPEAFEVAREQDKPVMLFIGAFWCAFCQRMDENAFSNEEVAALLNAYFVPVRCEDAQRPDVNARYNQNGWPTIVFMAPAGEPIAAVNYLKSEDFTSVLVRVYSAYHKEKDKLVTASTPKAVPPAPAAAVRVDKARPAAFAEISGALMAMADDVNGGFGPDHRFPHPEALDFLLYRFETGGKARYLDHVALTIDKLRAGATWDERGGGFFRYSSTPDWSEPHREKLLEDHAGILSNGLCLFRLSGRDKFRIIAEEIIDYLDATLSDKTGSAPGGPFWRCEDYVRPQGDDPLLADPANWYPVIDELIYTDANARTASAYLEAASVLKRQELKDRAIDVLDFLWTNCRSPEGSMCHYFDVEAHAPGLLTDQVYMGLAMLDAYVATEDSVYLDRALYLGGYVIAAHTNPSGGYHDIAHTGPAHLRVPLTLIVENGLAARFFLKLAEATGQDKYRRAADSALSAFSGDLAPYGVYAAIFGRALGEFMQPPTERIPPAGDLKIAGDSCA